jgi:EmrB/QacA subfamily drug resistance transporter
VGTGDRRDPWWSLIAVALGQFMVVVDVTILNVALPSLAQDLEASMPQLEWALIAYSLTMIGLVPVFGRISDVIGRKRLYLGGLLLFTGASALAAASGSIAFLIAARVLQAVGGAFITSNTLAILTDVFPAGRRGIAMGLQSIIISGGAAIGPALGGVLVSQFGWEAVFLVNVPIGLASATLALRVLPPLKTDREREPLDLLGAALLMAGLVASLVGLTRAPEWGWTSPATLGAFAIGIPMLVGFASWQTRARFPLVKPGLLRIRPFVAGQIAGLFGTLTLVGMVFMLPFYWQALRQFPAHVAGLLMLPTPIGLMLAAPVAGRLSDRVGARGLTAGGLSVAAGALLLLAQIGLETAIVDVLWRMLLFGIGLGMFLAPNNAAVMSAAPPQDRGVAAGLLALARFTGQALGIAFTGTLFLLAAGHAGSHGILTPEGFRLPEGAALDALRADFEVGYHTVCYALVPFALCGAALSWSRGRKTDPSPVALVAPGE